MIFRGNVELNEDKNKIRNYFQSVKDFFTNKKLVKRISITYQVVWNLLLLLIIILILGGAFASGIGAGYFASLVKDEKPRTYDSMKKDIYNYEATSEIYFADNKYLGKLRTDLEREEVKIKDVSEDLINAIISTEDEYFKEHNGVVPKAILRAIFQEVTNSAVQTGGSTLTQQLIKNQILTNEVSFDRKAKEILLALRLERFFDKEEILEAYLNVSPLGRNSAGRNIAGVQTAARGIFGVNASELTLPQAAFIAGLPQSPSAYTPFKPDGELKSNEGLEPGLNRMKTVLSRMKDNGYINQDQYKKALEYDIVKDFTAKDDNPISKYPYLTFEVEKRAKEILAEIIAEKDGYEKADLKEDEALYDEYHTLADRNLRQNGYKIYTTINKDIYEKMQTVKDKFQYYGSNRTEFVKNKETGEVEKIVEPVEVGAVLIENKSGKIISFVGGRDFEREQTNHATNASRPNGSTMKPLAVYAPALELGKVSPGSIIPDVEMSMVTGDGKTYTPRNYGGSYYGLVSARTALAKSFNVSAVKIYMDIINQRPAKFLEKMGFESLIETDYQNPSLSLGGITHGVTVEENVNAFATFGNKGKFVDAYMIEKIVDKDGNTIFEHQSKPAEVFSPQTAFLMIDMMRDVISQGTGTSLNSRLKFRADWAGKTGTSQNYGDAWFAATNPNVTFGVWMGYDTPKPLEVSYKGLSYGVRNIYLWADLMNAAYDVAPNLIAPKERFQMPGGIVRRSYCAISGLLPSEGCSKAGLVQSDLFNAKFVPTKVDDSLISGKYVEIGDKKYLALDSTPNDFALSGVILNPDFIKSIGGKYLKDPRQLIPNSDKWKNVLVPNDKLTENGKIPHPIKLNASGKTLTWKKHPDSDIIGYRVYQMNKAGTSRKIASIPEGKERAFKANDGEYFVTAVDIAGNESQPSNLVQVGQKKKPKVDEDERNKTEQEKPIKEEETVPPANKEEQIPEKDDLPIIPPSDDED